MTWTNQAPAAVAGGCQSPVPIQLRRGALFVRGGAVRLVAAAGVLALVMVAMACAPDPSDAVTGPEIYEAACVSCHGPAGGGGSAPRLNDGTVAAKYDAASMAAVIRDGVGLMLPNNGRLTQLQIDTVVAYVLGEMQGDTGAVSAGVGHEAALGRRAQVVSRQSSSMRSVSPQ